jgi:hypothetical protein
MNGNINQGDQHIILKKGSSANQDYNMTGNPYPSPVDIGTVLYHAWHRGAITGGAFYVWNPSAGAAGQYVAVPINTTTPTAWYLPAYSAFQVRAAHNGDTLHFSENDKGAAAAGYLFRQQSTGITLTVSDTSGKVWNRLTIHFDSGATAAEDRSDAALLQSPGFSWYSLSTDDKKLVIDHRPFTPTVALGIKSDQAGQFVIAANLADIPEDLWLRDKYLHTSVRLTSGLQYTFSITSNPASQGDARFELATAGNHDIDAEIISITPNPADNLLTVHFPASENQAVIDITDGSGKIVYHGTISANTALPVASLATGVYVVRLRFSNSSWTGKLLKR